MLSVRNHLLQSVATDPTTGRPLLIRPAPKRCSSFWTLISTSSAEAGIRKLKISRQCAIEYPFSPHKPAGGKSCVALLVWSVNWFSISDCHLKKSSLPTRHVQRTYKLAPSIDSKRGLNEKKKKTLKGIFHNTAFWTLQLVAKIL